MQIILMEKIANVGNLGDVVKVKDGFARNFLIPQGKAKRATEANVKMLEGKRAELEAAANAKLEAAQALGAKLEGLTVKITQKAGVDGRLFGSVTNSSGLAPCLAARDSSHATASSCSCAVAPKLSTDSDGGGITG